MSESHSLEEYAVRPDTAPLGEARYFGHSTSCPLFSVTNAAKESYDVRAKSRPATNAHPVPDAVTTLAMALCAEKGDESALRSRC